MTDTNEQATLPGIPAAPAFGTVMDHMDNLIGAKLDAQDAKAHAEDILSEIHNFAVRELANAKTFSQHIAPYAITAAFSGAIGAAVEFFLSR